MDPRQAGLILACFLSLGCSASRRIAVEANTISERAQHITELAEQIGNTSQEVESISTAAEIQLEAKQIRHSVAEIHGQLPGVTDRTPWWADLIKWLAIAGAGAALVWLLSATGLTTAIRIAIGWIPRRKVQEAELAVAALDETRPESLREVIAARRSADREFDAAWRKARGDVGLSVQGGYPAEKDPNAS